MRDVVSNKRKLGSWPGPRNGGPPNLSQSRYMAITCFSLLKNSQQFHMLPHRLHQHSSLLPCGTCNTSYAPAYHTLSIVAKAPDQVRRRQGHCKHQRSAQPMGLWRIKRGIRQALEHRNWFATTARCIAARRNLLQSAPAALRGRQGSLPLPKRD